MKKKISTWLACLLVLLLLVVPVLSGCESGGVGQPVDVSGEAPGIVTKVKSSWSSGNLVFEKKSDGTDILVLDGTNGDAEITSATITGGTATALTITTLTAPTISGTTTLNDLVSSNVTITGGSMTGVTLTAASPTFTGTMVNANVAMGTANVSAGEAACTVAHGMSGTPTIVIVSWAGDTGDDYYIYFSSADATNMYFLTSDNITNNTAFNWVAWIAGE